MAFKNYIILFCLSFITTAAIAGPSPQYDLIDAIEKQDLLEIKELLGKGVSPNTRRKSNGIPAMVFASDTGNIAIMKLMLEAGGRVDIATKDRGETPLMRAAIKRDLAFIQLLLEYNPDINKADIGQETALMKAVRARNYRVAQILLEKGANANVQDLTGKSALDYAQLRRSKRMIKLLEEHGAR